MHIYLLQKQEDQIEGERQVQDNIKKNLNAYYPITDY